MRSGDQAREDDDRLILNAYLDGELDAVSALDLERRFQSDAALAAEFERLSQLRSALKANVAKDRASADFFRRIEAIAAGPDCSPARFRTERVFEWRHLAAAAAIAAMIAGIGTYATMSRLLPGRAPSAEIAMLVAGHQRALLAAVPYDVASSDRHTVKPWFDSKLALSPKVVDLAAQGFALVGGRIDHAGGKSVPAIVYRAREHVISLIAVPVPGSADKGASTVKSTRDGYTVLTWPGTDFSYAAVSDLADADLDRFVSLWRAAGASHE